MAPQKKERLAAQKHMRECQHKDRKEWHHRDMGHSGKKIVKETGTMEREERLAALADWRECQHRKIAESSSKNRYRRYWPHKTLGESGNTQRRYIVL